ncbi:uncharacterized protein [Oscarella lobularis]|uniref:uncharacterized protein n=1 Tax=Oscarella lobularis TaxID=121494 RepID=UPI003313AE47
MSRLLVLFLAILPASASPNAPLRLYYSYAREDNAVYATEKGLESITPDYKFIRACSQIASNDTRLANTVPLYTYFSKEYNDTANVATEESIDYVKKQNYELVRIEGYVYTTSSDSSGGMPLKLYWSEARKDLFLAGCQEDVQSAIAAGYVLKSVEGYAANFFYDWPSTPPDDCPFEQSATFSGVQFGSRAGIYGHADTWFPSWASDDNLYSPWTDGSVNGTAGGNGKHTTGFAVAVGDDPLNLTITNIGTFSSIQAPYGGRYPSANLVYNGNWYYGTYALDNPQIPPDPAPNCGNWCVQGPFLDWRYSSVVSPTKPPEWHEPRVSMKNDTDNLFNQTSKNNTKVKIGAVHVVDFGKNMEHAPNGKVYVIGHGAESSSAHESWMQGDSVYLARGTPDPLQINNASAWEFYSGLGPDGVVIWSPYLHYAAPLFTWKNRTGVTTMTYVPALYKYITCVSTPTYSPYTVREFDTYFLESDNMMGPFSLIAYMAKFGPEAYFVNIPSKFVGTKVDKTGNGSFLDFYLSYSANFAMGRSQPNPPASGYHWTLLESRFKIKDTV